LATKNIRDLIHIVLDSALQEGRRRGSMAGKGGKGLIAAKTAAAGKDKKLPISRSSRAGLQVRTTDSDFFFLCFRFSVRSLAVCTMPLKFALLVRRFVLSSRA
jgi:hypothetical protein